MKLSNSQLPVPEDLFRASLEKYKSELEAHKHTVYVPAPWPDHELLRVIVANGGDFEIEDEPVVQPEPGKSVAQTIVDLIKADPEAFAALKAEFSKEKS